MRAMIMGKRMSSLVMKALRRQRKHERSRRSGIGVE